MKGTTIKVLLLALLQLPYLVSSMGQGNVFSVIRKRLEFMKYVQEYRYQQVEEESNDEYKLVIDAKQSTETPVNRRRLNRRRMNRHRRGFPGATRKVS